MNPVNPIEHVVIIVKENHTFDSYFGKFPGADGDPNLGACSDPPPNPPAFDHRHADWVARAQRAARLQYSQADIPAYWAYAQQFTLCDKYFTDVAGPSTPNHLMLIAADAGGLINNPSRQNPPLFDIPSLPQRLAAKGLDWRNYGGYAFDMIAALQGSEKSLPSGELFVQDAVAGALPAVSWVYAEEGSDRSEHPHQKVAAGMQWTVEKVNAVVEGNLWGSTAIFITWDDYGGWYDHVDPPPKVESGHQGTQYRYGSRVPCLVLSPYAKKGHVSSNLYSHVSLLRFCEITFGLDSLNQRDAQADGMSDCFDFNQTPLEPPAAAPAG
jgi:phospholipase C